MKIKPKHPRRSSSSRIRARWLAAAATAVFVVLTLLVLDVLNDHLLSSSSLLLISVADTTKSSKTTIQQKTTTTKTEETFAHYRNQNNNNSTTTTTTTTTTLWLVTCETRSNQEAYQLWLFSAEQVQRLNTEKQQQQQQQQQQDYYKVEIANVCANVTWEQDNMMLKFYHMQRFVQTLLNDNNNNNNNNKDTNDWVLFTDSDSIFNPWAVSISEFMNRVQNLLGGEPKEDHNHIHNKILVSAEPHFYLGMNYRPTWNDLQTLYGSNDDNNKDDKNHHHNNKNDTSNQNYTLLKGGAAAAAAAAQEEEEETTMSGRSSCPQFINSGQYLGRPTALWNMYQGVFNLPQQHLRGNPRSDQGRLTNWYAHQRRQQQQQQQRPHRHHHHHHHRDNNNNNNNKGDNDDALLVLDTQSLVFRTLMFGYINHKASPEYFHWTCGTTRDAYESCGQFRKRPYWGQVHTGSWQIQVTGVPGCPFDPLPFSIHAAGPKRIKTFFYQQLARKLRHVYCQHQQDLRWCSSQAV